MAYGGQDGKFAALEEEQKRNEELARAAAERKRLQDKQDVTRLSAEGGPGFQALLQTDQEREAGVTPPGFKGLSDINTGDLLSRYKYDPFSGEASQRLRTEALSSGPSEYAKNELQKQRFEQSQAGARAGQQQQTAQSQALSSLARMGGLSGGARTSLARSGARDALMAQQGVGAQGILSRYGINSKDMERRQNLLGQTAGLEQGASAKNIETSTSDLSAKAQFDANRYNQQMQAWAARKNADAQRDIAKSQNSGKK